MVIAANGLNVVTLNQKNRVYVNIKHIENPWFKFNICSISVQNLPGLIAHSKQHNLTTSHATHNEMCTKKKLFDWQVPVRTAY